MSRAHKSESFYHPVPFDPIQYVKKLESVGFTREQAEMQSETFFSIVQEQLITKQDLKESENTLKQTIKEIDAKTTLELEAIRRDIKESENKTTVALESMRQDTKAQIELQRRDLKIWFGGMIVTIIVAVSTLAKFAPYLTNH
jgi:multidrug resistance efflux pump